DQLKASTFHARFVDAMDDDFNTREAIAVLYDLVRDINAANRAGDQTTGQRLAAELKGFGAIFGLFQSDPDRYLQGELVQGDLAQAEAGQGISAEAIEALIAERIAAKANRDFARADGIRDELKEKGIVLEDSRDGTIWKRDTTWRKA